MSERGNGTWRMEPFDSRIQEIAHSHNRAKGARPAMSEPCAWRAASRMVEAAGVESQIGAFG